MYTLSLVLPILAALGARTLAQGDSNSSPTNMNLTIFTGPDCTGGSSTETLKYGTPSWVKNDVLFNSYKLSRNTTHQEQLDFSGPTPGMGSLDGLPQQCTLYHETTSPDSNGNTLAADKCYGLLLGPAGVSTQNSHTGTSQASIADYIQTVPQALHSWLVVQGMWMVCSTSGPYPVAIVFVLFCLCLCFNQFLPARTASKSLEFEIMAR